MMALCGTGELSRRWMQQSKPPRRGENLIDLEIADLITGAADGMLVIFRPDC
jgi:hypothetical protein